MHAPFISRNGGCDTMQGASCLLLQISQKQSRILVICFIRNHRIEQDQEV